MTSRSYHVLRAPPRLTTPHYAPHPCAQPLLCVLGFCTPTLARPNPRTHACTELARVAILRGVGPSIEPCRDACQRGALRRPFPHATICTAALHLPTVNKSQSFTHPHRLVRLPQRVARSDACASTCYRRTAVANVHDTAIRYRKHGHTYTQTRSLARPHLLPTLSYT